MFIYFTRLWASSNNSSTMCNGYPKDLVNKNVVSLKTGDASSYPSIIQGLPITYDDYMFVFCEAYTTIPENVDNASMTIAISGVSTGETIENNKYTIFKLNGSDDFGYVIDMEYSTLRQLVIPRLLYLTPYC